MRTLATPGSRCAWVRVGSTLLVVSLLVVACGAPGGASDDSPGDSPGNSPGESPKTLKIGVLAPLTGNVASDGEEMLRGAQLAADEINASGGVAGYQIEIVPGDTASRTPDQVQSALNRLLSDGEIHAIVTGYASTNNFEIDAMAEAEMPYLISANAVQTAEIISKDASAYPTVWSLSPSYDAYQTAMPGFIQELTDAGQVDLRNQKAYMVTTDNAYSQTIFEGMSEALTDSGWEVLGNDIVPYGEISDWHPIITKIRTADPALVINTTSDPSNGATFMLQFLENPTDSLLFIQYGPSVPEFITLTEERSSGVLYNLLGGQIPGNPLTTEIEDRFEAEYGVKSGFYGVALYTQINWYADALREVGDPADHLAIGNALGEVDKDVAQGHLKMDPDTHLAVQGDDGIPLLWFQIREGERVLIAPDQYASGPFVLPPWMEP